MKRLLSALMIIGATFFATASADAADPQFRNSTNGRGHNSHSHHGHNHTGHNHGGNNHGGGRNYGYGNHYGAFPVYGTYGTGLYTSGSYGNYGYGNFGYINPYPIIYANPYNSFANPAAFGYGPAAVQSFFGY